MKVYLLQSLTEMYYVIAHDMGEAEKMFIEKTNQQPHTIKMLIEDNYYLVPNHMDVINNQFKEKKQ